jgi:integrase
MSRTSVRATGTHRGRDLLEPAPEPARPAPVPEPPVPSRWSRAGIEEIVDQVRRLHTDRDPGSRYFGRSWATPGSAGARMILRHLATLPGESWLDRWSLFDAATIGRAWQDVGWPDRNTGENVKLAAGLGHLLILDVIRPSYAWQHRRGINVYPSLGRHRDPDGYAMVVGKAGELFGQRAAADHLVLMLGKVQAHTGKSVRQVSAADLLSADQALAELAVPSLHRRSLEHLWRLLAELGWLRHESLVWPSSRTRTAQLSPEQIVDLHQVASPHREVFIEYLKQRRPALDYSTYRSLGVKLLTHFWCDIARHHPGLASFALSRQIADGWKRRLLAGSDGELRVSRLNELFVVRAFYLDMAQWALEDSYWAQWAAPSPVSRAEVAGYGKLRRSQVSRTQHRTRQIAPLLPQLLARADLDRRACRALLETATAAGPGATVRVDGEPWTVRQANPDSPIRIQSGERARNLTREEDAAFWTWAIVEILRLTGMRCEELLELTHLSIVPYRVPDTGEEIPLLHISPSKTDQERLLVAGPELVHALSAVIHRVRGGRQAMPLTQRWDPGEHRLGAPLPHLICRPHGPELRPVTATTLITLLRRLAQRADLTVNGEPISFTSHDFRRIFATEALASGLPPHIVQVLLGHKNIATTQIYAAVYPEDVIRHHRTWISQRRLTRPSQEYRQPTPAEWEEFEGHFVKRKVSLGTCGRAYGTNCHHEHACVRCALLHLDPAQTERLREIIANLHDRVAEAENNNWLGEVEGLKISLNAAELKLQQAVNQPTASTINLGLPGRRKTDR